MSEIEDRLDEIAWSKANDVKSVKGDRKPKYSPYHESLLAEINRQVDELKVLVEEMREYLIAHAKRKRK